MKYLVLGMAIMLIPAVSWAQQSALVPAGYKLGFEITQNNMHMKEYVPEGETVENWSEMITIQIFTKLPAEPAAFLESIQRGWLAQCRGSEASKITTDQSSGNTVSKMFLVCPKIPSGKPENTLFKAIKSNGNIYVIQKAFHFNPTNEQIQQASHYLDSVTVCNTPPGNSLCYNP